MGNFDPKIWNRLYYEDGVIVAPVSPSLEENKRWIAIYKLRDLHDLDPQTDTHRQKYLVLDFEIKDELIDEYFSEEDKQNQARYYANSEDELFSLLNRLGLNLSLFTYPWKCDYPL